MLVLCKILIPFVNKLTDDDKYSLLNRDNLTQPIQIILSQKEKTFFIFLFIFEIYIIFWTFSKKKMTLIADLFRKIPSPKKVTG